MKWKYLTRTISKMFFQMSCNLNKICSLPFPYHIFRVIENVLKLESTLTENLYWYIQIYFYQHFTIRSLYEAPLYSLDSTYYTSLYDLMIWVELAQRNWNLHWNNIIAYHLKSYKRIHHSSCKVRLFMLITTNNSDDWKSLVIFELDYATSNQ